MKDKLHKTEFFSKITNLILTKINKSETLTKTNILQKREFKPAQKLSCPKENSPDRQTHAEPPCGKLLFLALFDFIFSTIFRFHHNTFDFLTEHACKNCIMCTSELRSRSNFIYLYTKKYRCRILLDLSRISPVKCSKCLEFRSRCPESF
jgi:hypothetical protein